MSWGAAQAWPVLVWRSRSVWIRPVVVRFGEAGLGQTGYGGHGHGEAVLIRCVRVRFDRVRTRFGGLGMINLG